MSVWSKICRTSLCLTLLWLVALAAVHQVAAARPVRQSKPAYPMPQAASAGLCDGRELRHWSAPKPSHPGYSELCVAYDAVERIEAEGYEDDASAGSAAVLDSATRWALLPTFRVTHLRDGRPAQAQQALLRVSVPRGPPT